MIEAGRSARRHRATLVLVLAVIGAPLYGFGAQQRPAGVLDAFDLSTGNATQVALGRALHEVSGLAVTADGRVLAHADESAVVEQLSPCRGSIERVLALGRPPVRGDFEGIAVAGARVFLVTSTGRLYETREGSKGAVAPFTVLDTGFGRSCEIEGLAYDPSERVLLLGCKQWLRPAMRDRVILLRWSLERRAPAVPPMLSIPLADLAAGTGSRSFHVSGIEREPRSGHYVLVAGPERLIAEVTPAGAVVAARPLNRRLHRQPEGITFLDSVMVISDEGGAGTATLTCYKRKGRMEGARGSDGRGT
jgi:uncharacterized protein YjiK